MGLTAKTTAAKTKQTTAAKTKPTEMPKANGWLNLSMTDKTGKSHNMPKGVALFDETVIHRSMLNKLRKMQQDAAAAGEAIPQTIQFNFTGTVSLARAEEAGDIDL